jgi:hypothetical protein
MAAFFPRHTAAMRQVARSTIGRTLALETEGKTEEGWALREALLKVSIRMQNDASALISCLVGRAIAQIALSRPGGAPKRMVADVRHPGESDKATEARVVRAREAEFSAYARRIGHPEAAEMARAQTEAMLQIEVVLDRVLADTPLLLPGVQNAALWIAGSLFLLLSALWTIFFGGLAFLLGRTRRIQRGEPLDSAVGWGLVLSLVPILLGAALATVDSYGVVFAIAALSLILTALFFLLRAVRRERQGHPLLIAGATALATLALIAVASVLVLGPTAFTGEAIQAMVPQEEATKSPAVPVLAGFLLGLLCMIVPLLAILGLAIWSRARRMPASVGIVRGFRGVAVPMASLLLIGYAAAVVLAAQDDARLRREMEEMVRHEARYYLRLAGKPWPRLPE